MTYLLRKRVTLGLIGGLFGVFGWLPASIPHGTTTGSSAAQAEGKSAPKQETWQVIYVDDQRIGYAREMTRAETQDGRTVVRTENESHMTIQRFGQKLRMETLLRTRETPDGELIDFVYEMKNPPAQPTRTSGRVEGEWLVLETTTAGQTDERKLQWDHRVKSPAWQERMLRRNPLKPGQSRSFQTFLPEVNRVTDVVVSAGDYRNVELHDGNRRKLLKLRVTQSVLPNMKMRAYVDREGKMVKSVADFIGTSKMITYTVPRKVALQEIAGAELDIAVNTLVRTKIIRNAHETDRVVYRIRTPGKDPADYLATGPTQQVQRVDRETVDVTVQAVPVESAAREQKTDARFLDSSRYLQIEDFRVVEHARRAAAVERDPAKIAVNMERYVHEKLTEKNFSTALASAAEVARNLEGDCTEHAILLAAMLRAKKIPSRLAVGMVYIESRAAFGGHMWTEAYLGGRWIPLDATLGRGGIGAGHIKLAHSSFDDDEGSPITAFLPLMNLLGDMQIDVVDVE